MKAISQSETKTVTHIVLLVCMVHLTIMHAVGLTAVYAVGESVTSFSMYAVCMLMTSVNMLLGIALTFVAGGLFETWRLDTSGSETRRILCLDTVMVALTVLNLVAAYAFGSLLQSQLGG